MGIILLGIWLIIWGINYLQPFLTAQLVGIGLIIVGAVILLEHFGVLHR